MTAWRNIRTRTQKRHFFELVKFLELELLKKHATTFCYHHPSHVLVELTTRCNLRCRWCNQSKPEWRKIHGNRDMPFENFSKIIPQLKGSRKILLYNIGEPLLYKELTEAISLAKKYIPEVAITTNGLLLNADIAVKLENAGLTSLNISIDSPDRDVMKRIRGVDLEIIADNLIEFGNACNIPVETWTVISQANAGTLKYLPEWAKQIPAIKSMYFQLQNGVEGGKKAGLPPLSSKKQFSSLQREIAGECCRLGLKTNIEALPFYPDGFQKKMARGICKAPFTQLISINVKGELLPCCSFPTYGLGNVVEKGFKTVWNGPDMRKWRKDMLEQKYCSYCSEWCGYKEYR